MWLLLTGIQRGREEQPRETRVSRPSAASRWWLRILKLPRRTNPVQRWRPAWLRLTTGTPPPLTSLPTSLTIYIITGIFGTSVYFSMSRPIITYFKQFGRLIYSFLSTVWFILSRYKCVLGCYGFLHEILDQKYTSVSGSFTAQLSVPGGGSACKRKVLCVDLPVRNTYGIFIVMITLCRELLQLVEFSFSWFKANLRRRDSALI